MMFLWLGIFTILSTACMHAMEMEPGAKPETIKDARLEVCIYRPEMILGYCGYHKAASVDWVNANMGTTLGYNMPLVTAILQKGEATQGERIYFPLTQLIELAIKKTITFKWKSDKKNDTTTYRLESIMHTNGLRSECSALIANTYKAFLQMKGSGYDNYPLHVSREDRHRYRVSKFYKITIGSEPSTLITSDDSFNFKEPNKIIQPIRNFFDSTAGGPFSNYDVLRISLEIELRDKKIIEKGSKGGIWHGVQGYPAFINPMIESTNKNKWLQVCELSKNKDSYLNILPPALILYLYYFLDVIKTEYIIHADLCRYHCQMERELMLENDTIAKDKK